MGREIPHMAFGQDERPADLHLTEAQFAQELDVELAEQKRLLQELADLNKGQDQNEMLGQTNLNLSQGDTIFPENQFSQEEELQMVRLAQAQQDGTYDLSLLGNQFVQNSDVPEYE